MQNIPIISYHKISDKREMGLTTVSCSQFRSQMQWLRHNGYQSILFEDLLAKHILPEKPIIITFDDGYENIYENAVPIMRETGFRGIIYIITNFIGKYNTWEAVSFQRKFRHMTAAQIMELQDAGFEFGVHGRSHFYLPVLSSDKLHEEVFNAKKYLETILKREVYSFCYPYGRLSDRVCQYVLQAGYTFAIRNLGIFDNKNDNRLQLQRRSIYSNDSQSDFMNKLIFPTELSISFISEWIIQKGALASIAINLINGSHLKR